jgi:RNA polymerase sigma-70 factor, ECF subfamily
VTFEEFFVERYGEVVRCMRLVVGDSTRAEELAEEAFVRAFRHWSRVSRLDRPVAWVYVVACNEARRAWRREQRVPKWWSGTERRVVEDAAGTVATVLDVRAALTQLGERQRAAVVLRYFADLPLAEIAAVMGCATGTVKATLHQALDRLRIELEVSDHAD